jgi:hypothetical protein
MTIPRPMNSNQETYLLTPALSSRSVWRRGRWNGAHSFWGSMLELLRGNLSLIPLSFSRSYRSGLECKRVCAAAMKPLNKGCG